MRRPRGREHPQLWKRTHPGQHQALVGPPHVQQYAGPVRVDSLGVSRVSPGHNGAHRSAGARADFTRPWSPPVATSVVLEATSVYIPLPQSPTQRPMPGNRLSTGRGHAGGSHWISPSGFGRRSVFLSVTTSGTGLDQVSAGTRQGFRVSRTNSRKASEGVTERRDTIHVDGGPGNSLYLHLREQVG